MTTLFPFREDSGHLEGGKSKRYLREIRNHNQHRLCSSIRRGKCRNSESKSQSACCTDDSADTPRRVVRNTRGCDGWMDEPATMSDVDVWWRHMVTDSGSETEYCLNVNLTVQMLFVCTVAQMITFLLKGKLVQLK